MHLLLLSHFSRVRLCGTPPGEPLELGLEPWSFSFLLNVFPLPSLPLNNFIQGSLTFQTGHCSDQDGTPLP